jgi:hypothetical protein
LPARMALATTSIFCQHIRIGSAVGRSPFTYFPNPQGNGAGTYPPPSLPSDAGLLIALYSSARYVNKVFLRGLPESIVSLEEKIPDGAWDNAFSAFSDFLVGTGLVCIRTVLGTVYTHKTIVSITHASPKGIRLIIPTADTLNVGDTIRIHGVSIPGYNGLKVVAQSVGPVSTGNLYVLGGANPISDPPTTDQSYYTAQTVQMPALATIEIERPTNRKTGRPFDLPRGRARTLFSLRA